MFSTTITEDAWQTCNTLMARFHAKEVKMTTKYDWIVKCVFWLSSCSYKVFSKWIRYCQQLQGVLC